MRILVLPVVALVVACGGEPKKEPVDPSTASGSEPPTTAGEAQPAAKTPPAAAEPVKKRKPYEIVNLCTRPATIIFGEDPKAAGAGSRTLAGNDKIEDGPRDGEGNQIVHLVVRGEPLVRVRVSRATKRVEIGTSCDTLEMH